jgi:SAM-dependent methyltransferase
LLDSAPRGNPGQADVSQVETYGTERTTGLERWFTGPLGQILLEKESTLLCQGVRRFHGDALLWLGPAALPQVELDRCMVRYRIHGALTHESARILREDGRQNVFIGDIDNLPFAPGSFDAVVVHHGFECSPDPRTAMREVAKALRPGGRMLVCAFNPWSFWGVRRSVQGIVQPALRRVRFVSPMRLLDWLAVLGFELDDDVRYLMYRPPLAQVDFDRSWWRASRSFLESSRLPVGGVYFVLARKSAAALLPGNDIRPRHAVKLVGAALPGSTARTAR